MLNQDVWLVFRIGNINCILFLQSVWHLLSLFLTVLFDRRTRLWIHAYINLPLSFRHSFFEKKTKQKILLLEHGIHIVRKNFYRHWYFLEVSDKAEIFLVNASMEYFSQINEISMKWRKTKYYQKHFASESFSIYPYQIMFQDSCNWICPYWTDSS